MADVLGNNGVLQVMGPAQLEQKLQDEAAARAAAAAPPPADMTDLAGFIRGRLSAFRRHRDSASGWSSRCLQAMQTYNGRYNPTQLQDIQKFGGSDIYARITTQKCRAASSLLRDIYLGQDQPWALRSAADPDIPSEIVQGIEQLLQAENQMVLQHGGQAPRPNDVDHRRRSLLDSAKDAAKKKARAQARQSEEKIEELLRNGGFYQALAEFLVDLPIFPFACIKGPVVRITPQVTWPEGGGEPTVEHKPTLTWQRTSPFDLWFTPGVSDISNADVIEKLRLTRGEINELLDLPGYNTEEIRAVLDEYGRGGLNDEPDGTDSERAVLESRENPTQNDSGMITMFEFNGNVQGRMLQDYGLAVKDELRDYSIQAWLIGTHVIKAHLSPSPRQRHPYFITSFEKVPGTPIGNALTDLLEDMQTAANATLRALVNNISIASGPQVVINDDRLTPGENTEDLYPWKRWHTHDDPMANRSQAPISFFMPTSNSQAMIEAYREFVSIADDVSAIPKYVGGQAGGGAGRTASGLAMLMGNASKILQTVSANIDRDVLEPALLQLVDLILLTDASGLLSGQEKVSVQGVNVAIQRETLRQRQIEFLSATVNPVDQHIMGIKGRAAVLRSVSSTIGMDGEDIVPDEDSIDKMEQAEKAAKADGNRQAIEQAVEEGVQKGVEAGVARIATELTAGALAMRAHLPEGNPTHLGTVPMDQAASQGQGMQPKKLSESMGPQTALTGSQPGSKAKPVTGGVG